MDGIIALCRSLAMVVSVVVPAFTVPSAVSLQCLMAGWVLARGRRTITAMIRSARLIRLKSYSSFHRFLSQGCWDVDEVSRLWARFLVGELYPRGAIPLVGDDSLLKHRGPKLYGAGVFRDGVLSSHGHTVFHWGHNWVVLALPVQFPLWPKRWFCLPILCRLRAKGESATTVDRMQEMLAVFKGWFPGRRIEFCGDGSYNPLAERKGLAAVLLTRLRVDAELFALPPRKRPRRAGRPRVRGPKLPGPRQMAADPQTRWHRARLRLYGERRLVQYHSRLVIWSRTRREPVRVVLVREVGKPERLDCLMCTDTTASPQWIIRSYARRYCVERTFEDAKQGLGVEHLQVRTARSVLRAAPLGLLLYGMIVYWYAEHHARQQPPSEEPWYRTKPHESFQDMLAQARLESWRESIFCRFGDHPDTAKIIHPLLSALSGVG